jgi:hypothetical protein
MQTKGDESVMGCMGTPIEVPRCGDVARPFA